MNRKAVLLDAAQTLRERGWTKGTFGAYGEGPCCLMGALTDAYTKLRHPQFYAENAGRIITWRVDTEDEAYSANEFMIRDPEFWDLVSEVDGFMVDRYWESDWPPHDRHPGDATTEINDNISAISDWVEYGDDYDRVPAPASDSLVAAGILEELAGRVES